MSLEASYPFLRPVLHARANAMGEIRLWRGEVGQCPFLLGMKLIPNKTAFVQLETEYRGVSYLRIGPK